MENKKTITITQQVKELVYDIQNKAYLTGVSREADGSKNYDAASNMQASDDAESIYQIRRSLTNAFAALKCQLGEFLVDGNTESNDLINNEIDNNSTLVLEFNLPNNYNLASIDSLGNSIHAYLVDAALSEWFAITNKEDEETYARHLLVSLENVKRALYKRSRPTRKI